MAFKTILVCLNDIPRNAALLGAAASLARDFDAHIVGLYVVPAIEIYGGGIAAMPVVFDGRRDYFQNASAPTKDAFEVALRNEGLRGHFEQVDATISDITALLVEYARRVDLVIISQSGSAENAMLESDSVERTVLSTGRPVLVIPREGKAGLDGDVAIVGWNGSREAARAAFDSIPLLRRMRDVRIAWVDPEAEFHSPGPLPGAEIAESLSRHGIKVVVEPLSTGGSKDAGEALLQKVSDEGASLIVMGAYGHSRLREFILGGATRSVLDGMTCPVLFSH